MPDRLLVIGNHNYSSWSLRPWLALKHLGVPFRLERIALDQPDTAACIRRHSPGGRVPVLVDGDVTIWESLAIIEHLAEAHPQLWPSEPVARKYPPAEPGALVMSRSKRRAGSPRGSG
jgi:glutathione S-transferase